MGWCPFPDACHDLRLGLAKLPRLFEARDGQAGACLRLPTNINYDQVTTLGQRDVFDQPAQELLSLSIGGGGSLPERRQILGQRADLFPLLCRQHQCSRSRQDLVFAL